VTTVVTENCGSGTFKISETKAKWEKQGIGTNAVLLVGYGTVRHEVLGDENRAPTPEEPEKMKSIFRQSIRKMSSLPAYMLQMNDRGLLIEDTRLIPIFLILRKSGITLLTSISTSTAQELNMF